MRVRTTMTDQQPDPENEARDEVFRQIAATAKSTEDFTNQASRAEALKNLAEAWAFLVSPSNSH
ncbi:hypothetical protein ACFO3J_24220 [Streptomyces polygonati]|uniref:Uncharacterized protein n=1 Tax=Streptomyces polygonati TaxID=1617087 RepID=A0ABV8HUA8_9ACTN